MQDANNPYASFGAPPVAEAMATERVEFIKKTYLHLAGAILAFVALSWAFLQIPITQDLARKMAFSGWGWLIVLALFMGASWVADRWAHTPGSVGRQYAGLSLLVVAQSLIFLPLLFIATKYSTPDVIPKAAILTLFLFSGLTVVAFTTKADFSFLGGAIKVGGFVALGMIVLMMFFPASSTLSLVFSGGMVCLAGASVLYNTSNIMREYPVGYHVGAALGLFASIALMFWYILQLFMRMDD